MAIHIALLRALPMELARICTVGPPTTPAGIFMSFSHRPK